MSAVQTKALSWRAEARARKARAHLEATIEYQADLRFVAATNTLFEAMTDLEVLGLGGVTNLGSGPTCVIGQLALMQGYDTDVPCRFVAQTYRIPYAVAETVYYGVLYSFNVPYFELMLARRLDRIAAQKRIRRPA
jgi:hypothetical protein